MISVKQTNQKGTETMKEQMKKNKKKQMRSRQKHRQAAFVEITL